MRKHRRATALTLALAGGLLAAPALYAHAAADAQDGGMMGGMMQQEGGPMMGGGGMMGQMQEMMANCNRMMQMMQARMQDQGHGGPTEQERMPQNQEAPVSPPMSPENGG